LASIDSARYSSTAFFDSVETAASSREASRAAVA
jgi:hypothetical protein